MITVAVVAFKDPGVTNTLASIINQEPAKKEILVAAPDEVTLNLVRTFAKENKVNLKIIKDLGKGKPAALNLMFKQAKGDILVLTDGDVILGESSITELLKPFSNLKTGIVSGKPVSVNARRGIFGYWSHLLTEVGAHRERLYQTSKNKFVPCSGYLMAIRNVIGAIPENSLADDAIITYKIWEKGHKIVYAPDAKVYVRYPDNWEDWVKQKRRAIGGYLQFKELLGVKSESRNFAQEALRGTLVTLGYAKNTKEFVWSCLLLLARIHVWLLAYLDFVSKKQFKQIWLPVQSTKRWD